MKKKQGKSPERNLNEKVISNLHDKEFKVIVIKMFTDLQRRMDEYSKNFNKKIGNIRKYQTDVITELKIHERGSTAECMK